MGIFSIFMGGEKEPNPVGETGPEDEILVAIIDQPRGATLAKLRKSLEERGKEVDDAVFNTSLEKLVRDGRIFWDEKLQGYCLEKEETEEN